MVPAMNIKDAERRVRDFLANQQIELVPVALSDISMPIYNKQQYANCYIFRYRLGQDLTIDGDRYIAVPINGDQPINIR